jgi:hypothetical protein
MNNSEKSSRLMQGNLSGKDAQSLLNININS